MEEVEHRADQSKRVLLNPQFPPGLEQQGERPMDCTVREISLCFASRVPVSIDSRVLI